MKFIIKDFVDAHPMEIIDTVNKGRPLVVLVQFSGSMHFQHAMRPEQARYMAAALQMAAEEVENATNKPNLEVVQ